MIVLGDALTDSTYEAKMSFQDKRDARITRMKARAAGMRAERDRQHATVNRLGEVMQGQPIQVGHHSEKRHRRDLDRMGESMRKVGQLDREQRALECRAEAAERSTAVFSDDPDAVVKIKAKIANREAFRVQCKAINVALRKAQKAGSDWQPVARTALAALGLSERAIAAAITPDFAGRLGVPSYVSTNTGAEIRRLKQRLAQLAVSAERDGREEQIGEIQIVEAENRVRLFFPDKPDAEIRRLLKSRGFRWAPSSGAWQKHASVAAWLDARHVAAKVPLG